MPGTSPIEVVVTPCLGKNEHNAVQVYHLPPEAVPGGIGKKIHLLSNPSSSLSLDKYSTLTTVSSEHSSLSFNSELECSSINLTQIPSRFVFSEIKKHTASPTKKRRFTIFSQLKKVLIRQKKKAYPLIDALEKRQGPSIKDCYGAFVDVIGSGNGGSIYLTRKKASLQYAVKSFRQRFPGESEAQYYEWLSNEIFIAASVQHPCIIDIHDVVLEDGEIYQVMEHCPTDLFRIVNSGEMTIDQANKYFIQLIQGLGYLHERGFGHRDLKLENICVNANDHIKIIDFGCAIVFKTFGHQPKLVEDICGSDPYIAPEIFNGEAYDVRKADIWSAAIIYITMVLQKFPWEIARSNNKSYKLYLEHLATGRFFTKIPSVASTILKRMLDPNPNMRATMDEIMADEWIQSLSSQ
ncbi:Pkinase-domain-containing protein [Basidiobolus meristosporus CBS 931.73]|uniref:Pkinase-domain-containing protein n=1 Tax=Basidiobolus meristosporus CBS 931.73 TaxID=1314790 RepID=A0A1Y1ZAU0_9FUNG|nr:Pkinase-domain-containing protein [Basidiobolus meristosporus CBS 931.73]|eukprot:ORY07117.1 Pkinase-domain-containing protein [Basidiobolus meristosporus CBS 931.73]